jgi:endonuclease-8
MPEGPEIHREADRLGKALTGQVAERVFFAFARLEPWQATLAGRRVVGVEARGKAMLVRFEGDVGVYTHNQLYGRWTVARDGALPATRRSLRFAIHTARASALLYSASTIEVLSPEEEAAHPFLSRLGPDPLALTCTPAVLARALRTSRARRQLGALLLDQGFVAGIGNYLRSEILFAAELTPERTLSTLTAAEGRRLAQALWEVTRRAYESGGITRELEDARRLRRAGLRRREYRHWVFGLGGRPCPRCTSPIARETHAGRRVYVCRACQR